MDANTLTSFDPAQKVKVDQERTFVRLPKPVKDALRVQAEAAKLSLNAYIVHLCVRDLQKAG
jgi:hypothetical protein